MVISGARLGAFSVSETGLLVYNTGAVDLRSELVWISRDGEELENLGIGNLFFDLAVSPDGRYAAVAELESGAGTPDVWLFDLVRNLRTRFTFDSTNDWYPAWSPDAAQIAFASSRNGTNDIWVKGVGGSGEAELLYGETEFNLHPQSWSPNGELLVYERVAPDNNSDIWAINADGSQPTELVSSSFNESYPSISPDGRWMAYVSDESGSDEIYVTTFPEPARRWQVSTDGGTYPRWRDDGSELFYVKAGGELQVAEIDGSGPALVVGEISELFSWNMSAGLRNTFDAAPDGQRVLVIRGLASSETEPLRVVLNWDLELEALRR
jgi:Tol biopolymer transport system component